MRRFSVDLKVARFIEVEYFIVKVHCYVGREAVGIQIGIMAKTDDIFKVPFNADKMEAGSWL